MLFFAENSEMVELFTKIKKTYGMAEPDERDAVLNNFAFLSGLQAFSYFLPLIILPYLFRTIGPAKFGLISFAQALTQYFMTLTDYGFNVSATKEVSLRQNDPAEVDKIFSAVMTLKVIFAFLSLLILSGLVYFIPRFRTDGLVYIFSFGAVIGNTLFPLWFFQGMEKMRYIAKVNIIGEFLCVALVFFLIHAPDDYLMVPLINSSVLLITGILGQYVVFKRLGSRFIFPEMAHLREHFISGWNVFTSVLAINAYTTTRILAIGLFTNNTITGFYSLAEKLAGLCQTFPLNSFSQALFPRLSKIFHKNKKRAFALMEQIQHITVNISLITLPTIFISCSFLIKIIFGGSFPETIVVLRILLVSVLIISSNAFRVQFLLISGHPHLYSKIHITMALIGLPLILACIYYFSYMGAAFATVAIEAGIFTLTHLAFRKISFSAK